MSLQLTALNGYLRRVERPVLARLESGAAGRARLERNAARFFRDVPGVRHRPVTFDSAEGLRGQMVGPVTSPPRAAVLYLHGGGFAFGSSETHRRLGGAIASASGLDVFLPDYRLAPEHPFPAGLDDCFAAYMGMREMGLDRIAVIGDSAGGGLAFSLLARLIAESAPLPFACVGLSPWVDLTCQSQSHQRNDRSEVTLPTERMAATAATYLNGVAPDDPFASPVFARLDGAPPCLLHVSACEILEDDTHALAETLRRDGSDVTVRTWDRTPHVWHLYHGMLPEADAAIADLAGFLQSTVKALD